MIGLFGHKAGGDGQDRQRFKFKVTRRFGLSVLEKQELVFRKRSKNSNRKRLMWKSEPLEFYSRRLWAVIAGQVWVRERQLKRYTYTGKAA